MQNSALKRILEGRYQIATKTAFLLTLGKLKISLEMSCRKPFASFGRPSVK
jgi:hypothetical protein